jgi:alpha-1,3-glucosyltransferase
MRLTAFFTDILLFFPAVIYTISKLYPRKSVSNQLVAVAFNLCLPALILIDHGHFQYDLR